MVHIKVFSVTKSSNMKWQIPPPPMCGAVKNIIEMNTALNFYFSYYYIESIVLQIGSKIHIQRLLKATYIYPAV